MNTKLAYWMGLTLLVVVWSCPAIGQTFVELEEYEIRSLVFSGHIGEGTEMPVTFCLNVERQVIRSFGLVFGIRLVPIRPS